MTQSTAGQSPETLLPRWANQQDSWIRTIVNDVLRNRAQSAEGDIDRYVRLFQGEKKLSDEPFEATPKIEEKQVDANPLESVRVDSIKTGEGINALKAGAQIDFASGVTVVFGENGSGKSGFVRVLKRAAGARTAEDILHNVRGVARPTPSATFDVTIGATSNTIEWKNEFGVVPLNRASIFDTRGARVHVEEDLSYVYTPGELTLFPLVQNAIERVRSALERAIASRGPGVNTLLGSFDRASSIYASIEALGAATDIEDIRRYSVLPVNSDGLIESLKTEIDALKSSNIQNELRRTRDRSTVVDALKTAIQVVRTFDVATYDVLVNARNEAEQQRDRAGNTAFDGLSIPGLLAAEWRTFIQAGEDYLKKHTTDNYPRDGDDCVYCRQPLTAQALDLVKKYREYTNNDIRAALDSAERQLREYAAPILALNASALEQRYAAEARDAGDVLAPVGSVVENIRRIAERVGSSSAIGWTDKDSALSAAAEIVSEELTRLNAFAASLQASIEERQGALRRKQVELVELQAKQASSRLLPQIERRVADAKWVSRANIFKNGISSVLRSLTETAKDASEELLNKGFEKRFQDESRRLRAPNVTINFPGRQGQVTRRKTVAAYKPHQVLSEGELKALALADFLAEVTAVPASSPVIFDDPITSMDYRRIHEVCDRIVALANEHQIIVFTHNIWFAAELLAKADKKKWKYYDIRSEGADSGLLSSATHPRVDTIAQVSSRVRKMIDGAERTDGEIRAAIVEKGYEELRGLCEIIVEHEMLKGVVQRYAPNVMMTKVEKINVAKLQESMSAIMPVFEKACRYIASHSQPIETQGIRPGLDELKADYEAVVKAREPHKE